MLSLKHSNAINKLADAFYSFLPGSGNKKWSNHITFATVASNCGVGHFWKAGSKLPAIIYLLENTYEHAGGNFEKLVTQIITRGIVYRRKRNPIAREEIEHINSILLNLERKFPPLWNREFLENLPSHPKENSTKQKSYNYGLFLKKFNELLKEKNKQKAGLDFEKFLYDLFEHFNLAPSKPFSLLGEQIDGSFELDHQTYLIEAKWCYNPIQQKDLLVFRGKIEGKSRFTRGVFISYSGYTKNSTEALHKGKELTFFLLDGEELYYILYNEINLIDVLRFKRRAMEEGNIYSHHPDCRI